MSSYPSKKFKSEETWSVFLKKKFAFRRNRYFFIKATLLVLLLVLIIKTFQFWFNLQPNEGPTNNPVPTVSRIIPTPLPEDMIIRDIQKKMPNVPAVYWMENQEDLPNFNSTCAAFPDLFNIEFSNTYWQTLRTTNGTFQLLGAYLDVRKRNTLGPTVRILAMLDRIEPIVRTYCQFWFENHKQPVIVKTFEYKCIWMKDWGNHQQGIYQPYLITCPIPSQYWALAPEAVSMVEHPCDNATNSLRVIYNKSNVKKDFAVCAKGLNAPYLDMSAKLAEWIELLIIMGVDKIFFYELQVHPNVKKLLNYYQARGNVHVTPLNLAGGQPNGPILQSYFLKKRPIFKRQNELIPYNDCFYKHMYEYKYIVPLDTNEIIIPIKFDTWKEVVNKTLREAMKAKRIERASFNVQNIYFLDDLLHEHGWFKDVPEYMYMIQHVYRTKKFTKPGFSIKSFLNTEKVVTLHNHYPLSCLGGCYSYAINTSDAQLQHYRNDCVNELKEKCDDLRSRSIIDVTIWKYVDPLVDRVVSTLKTLELVK